MVEISFSQILTALLVITLTQSVCQGLERPASDYVAPFYKANQLDSLSIGERAAWLSRVLEDQCRDESPIGVMNFLKAFKRKLCENVSLPEASGLSGQCELLSELDGLPNEDFYGEIARNTLSFLRVDGTTEEMVRIINQLIEMDTDATHPREAWQERHCKTESMLLFTKVFWTLYKLPFDNSVVIYDTGIKFGPPAMEYFHQKFYRLMRYLASKRLGECLRSIPFTFRTRSEENLDLFLINRYNNPDQTDQNLWRSAFQLSFATPRHLDIFQDALDRSGLSRKPDFDGNVSKFLRITCERFRRDVDRSAGMVTLAILLAPKELRKFEKLSLPLSKRIEYLRICNEVRTSEVLFQEDRAPSSSSAIAL